MKLRFPSDRHRLLPIGLAQFVGLVCGVFGVRVVSQLVTPAALGAYGVFLTFTTIGTWIVYSGLIKLVGRYWAAAEHGPFLHAVTVAWTRKLGWLLLGAAVATTLVGRMTALPRSVILGAVLVSAAALSIAGLGQAALQAARRNWADLAASTVGSVTRTFIPPLLFSAIGTIGLYAGFTVHAACFAAVAFVAVRRTMRREAGTGAAVLAPVYQGPLFTTLALFGWILSGENRWLAAWRFGDVTAGYFTLGSNMALIVPTMLGAIALQLLQPRFYALGDSDRGEVRTQLAREIDYTAAVFLVLAVAGLVLLRLVAPGLIGTLIHERYAASVEWLLPAGCFGVATTMAGLYHTLLLAGRRERGCAAADVATAAVLTTGAVVTACAGVQFFKVWLMATPAVPWLVTRPMARRHLFSAAPNGAPAPGP